MSLIRCGPFVKGESALPSDALLAPASGARKRIS
jgi:hypothetical protein